MRFRRICAPAARYRRTGPYSGLLPSTGPTSALREIQRRKTLQQHSLFPRPPAFLLRNPERRCTRPHITRSGRHVTSADEHVPILGPGETLSMYQPPIPLLDPACPPGGADVQPSCRTTHNPPQHPHGPGSAGVSEVGRGVDRSYQVLGLTAPGRCGREFVRRAEVLGPCQAQHALPVGRERKATEVSSVDPDEEGNYSLFQSQDLRALGVEDLSHQPEIRLHSPLPFAWTGG